MVRPQTRKGNVQSLRIRQVSVPEHCSRNGNLHKTEIDGGQALHLSQALGGSGLWVFNLGCHHWAARGLNAKEHFHKPVHTTLRPLINSLMSEPTRVRVHSSCFIDLQRKIRSCLEGGKHAHSASHVILFSIVSILHTPIIIPI